MQSSPARSGFVLPTRVQSKVAVFAFIALTFAWTWGLSFIAGQFKGDLMPLSNGLRILATFGPSLAAVAVVGLTQGSAGLRAWLVRCLDWRVGWRWYGLAFLTPPVLIVAAIWLDVAFGGVMPGFLAAEKIPLAIANFRLRQAARSLVHTDLTIEAIAEQTGFADRVHFTHAFSRFFRVSPAAYRRDGRAEHNNELDLT